MAEQDIDWGGVEQRLKDEASKRGLAYDASDLEGIKRNTSYSVGGVNLDQALSNQVGIYDKRAAPSQPQASSPAQQWNTQPQANQQRSDGLYAELMGRAKQGLDVNRNDPVIRQQADAFSANQERSRRNYLSDVAERSGPYANLQGERRMAAERAGVASGAFEAELMGREVSARRDEIQQALQLWGHMLSGDQQRALQQELAQLEASLRREQMGQQNDQFMRELALREFDTNNAWDYRWTMGA